MQDFESLLPSLYECQHLTEAEMKSLCERVKELQMEEGNVQPVMSPVTICGDIHGQFWDLIELLRTGGKVEDGQRYVFMGDFVDRGRNSLETVTLLFLLKACWPDRVTLLRGNHESRQITQVYGFYDECQQKYGSAAVWKACCSVFDFLNLAAIIDGTVLCVHGGLSPDVRSLDQIRLLSRNQEIPHEGAFCDLMWSDPDDIENWAVSPRGAGWLFGGSITREFNHVNQLSLIGRAHQLVQEGWKVMHQYSSLQDEISDVSPVGKVPPPRPIALPEPEGDEMTTEIRIGGEKNGEEERGDVRVNVEIPVPAYDSALCTVWSAPNYCYRCGNMASILSISDTSRVFKVFGPAAENNRPGPTPDRRPFGASRGGMLPQYFT
ncbi:putative serine/threonine-protein phosphatase C26H8.05c [Flagelloscypha sp. PMI_526]|nr:putative serine/threonine-protein phosphatase C26H8.05c [Flagelloscypha sp. PMI_526]